MTGWRNAPGLYYHTARHLRPVQVKHRLRSQLRKRVLPTTTAPSPERVQYRLAEVHVPVATRLRARAPEASIANADSLVNGTFMFVGETVSYWDDVDWAAPQQSRLWRFCLHGFDWAFELAVAHWLTGREMYFVKFRELVDSWIATNRLIRGDAWHPYPVSLRIVNWILASLVFSLALDQDQAFRQRLLGSAHYQTQYLGCNLEYDLLANHLLKNIKALFIAGSFFSDPVAQRLRRQGSSMLTEEVREQVLADGCHFERSPTYHCLVLQDLLDCLLFAEATSADITEELREKVTRMADFLQSMLFQDGTYPLFNDAAYNLAPAAGKVLTYAEELLGERAGAADGRRPEQVSSGSLSLIHHRDSGYVIAQSPRLRLFVDAGELGPNYQLGHAHCDLFSFELALDGQRVIVDSGTPTYAEGELRTACRSTHAHNTLMIDNVEQAEIWKSFRVARRPKPHNVTVQHSDDLVTLSGWHDGYRRLPGRPVHKRTVFLIGEAVLVVFDEITGTGTHHVASFLHLHPAATWDGDNYLVRMNNLAFKVLPLDGLAFSAEPGFYAPIIGFSEKTTVLRLEAHGGLPRRLAYVLAPADCRIAGLKSMHQGNGLTIEYAQSSHQLVPVGEKWKLRTE